MPKGKKGFQKGNKIAVGRRSAASTSRTYRIIQQQMISSLNEPEDGRKPNGPTKLRVIIEKLIDMAIDGDIVAAALIFDRVEGRPMQAAQFEDVTEKRPLPEGITEEELEKLSENELAALYDEAVKASQTRAYTEGK